jgi:hypothetical protein
MMVKRLLDRAQELALGGHLVEDARTVAAQVAHQLGQAPADAGRARVDRLGLVEAPKLVRGRHQRPAVVARCSGMAFRPPGPRRCASGRPEEGRR